MHAVVVCSVTPLSARRNVCMSPCASLFNSQIQCYPFRTHFQAQHISRLCVVVCLPQKETAQLLQPKYMNKT